jgi:hypothetical protein
MQSMRTNIISFFDDGGRDIHIECSKQFK